jgi:hypothetical protein
MNTLTDLDVTTSIKKNVVTLDITVDDGLVVQVLKPTASLLLSVQFFREILFSLPQDKW